MPLHTTQIHSATLESGVLDDDEVLDCLRQFKRTRNIRLGLSLSGVKQSETLFKALEIPCDPAAPAGCLFFLLSMFFFLLSKALEIQCDPAAPAGFSFLISMFFFYFPRHLRSSAIPLRPRGVS
jgi:hypothetical protein